jgi:hypothetical protein
LYFVLFTRREKEFGEKQGTGEDSAVNDFVIGTTEQMAHSGENRNTQRVLMEKTGRRWKDNRKTEFKAIRWENMDWIDLAQDRGQWLAVVNTALNPRIP